MSVLTLRPNSGVLSEQFRSSGEHNYECIDEATLDTSDKTSINTSSSMDSIKTDLYGFPNHGSEEGTINKITIKAYLKSTEKGTAPTHVNFAIRIGSTNYFAAEQNIDNHDDYALFSQEYATKPDGSGAWSWSDIDDLIAGDKLTANYVDKNNNSSIDKAQLWVEVTYGEEGGNIKKIKIDGVWKTISSTKIMIDGVWKNVTSNKIFINDTWKS